MSVYYNEYDAKAAQWLRNLIEAGLIPPGDVDERSIADVKAETLERYTQCHFFAGIGGWPLALQIAGVRADEPVWTGSCPCQPFSVAGKGKGTADERHLWPEFARLIAECRPPIVIGEQVASKAGRGWLAGVRADLEALGYAVGAADLCAASAGETGYEVSFSWIWEDEDEEEAEACWDAAVPCIVGPPHIRQRLFWGAIRVDGLGYSNMLQPTKSSRARSGSNQEEATGPCGESPRPSPVDRLAHPRLEGHSGDVADGDQPGRVGADAAGSVAAGGGSGGVANPSSERLEGKPVCVCQGAGRGAEEVSEVAGGGATGGLADAEHAKRRPLSVDREDGRNGQDGRREEAHRESGACGEVCVLADGEGGRQRVVRGASREPGQPDIGGADGRGCAGDPWADCIYIPCADGKWRPVPAIESLLRSVADGLPFDLDQLLPEDGHPVTAQDIKGRVAMLRGIGNAIVPRLAAEFVQAFVGAVLDMK